MFSVCEIYSVRGKMEPHRVHLTPKVNIQSRNIYQNIHVFYTNLWHIYNVSSKLL